MINQNSFSFTLRFNIAQFWNHWTKFTREFQPLKIESRSWKPLSGLSKVKVLSMSMQDLWSLEISLMITIDLCIDIDKNFIFNRPDNGSQLLDSIFSGCNSIVNLVLWFQNCAMLNLRVKENELLIVKHLMRNQVQLYHFINKSKIFI